MNRLDRILRERKVKGLKWAELSEGLSISGEGLRVAFTRKSVDEAYLDHVEKKLGLKPTEPTNKKPPERDQRFEDLIAEKVFERIAPLLNGNTDSLLKALANLHIEINKIKIAQMKTQESVKVIEERV